jgi:hypothetical protein
LRRNQRAFPQLYRKIPRVIFAEDRTQCRRGNTRVRILRNKPFYFANLRLAYTPKDRAVGPERPF